MIWKSIEHELFLEIKQFFYFWQILFLGLSLSSNFFNSKFLAINLESDLGIQYLVLGFLKKTCFVKLLIILTVRNIEFLFKDCGQLFS